MSSSCSRCRSPTSSCAPDSTHFPAPNPALGAVTANIDALARAETTARSRTSGMIKLRELKRAAVISDLRALRRHRRGRYRRRSSPSPSPSPPPSLSPSLSPSQSASPVAFEVRRCRR